MQVKPALFIHIPKTAGGSILTLLNNVFGDCNVKRITATDWSVARREVVAVATDVATTRLGCLVGHLPVQFISDYLSYFHVFSILRDPVARVISLYRFHRDRAQSIHERLHLPLDFSFREFISSPHPELVYQTNDGMCRMLCSHPGASDESASAFWDLSSISGLVEQAFDVLERGCFGLTEDIPGTLQLLREHWALPFSLDEYFENQSRHVGLELSDADLARVRAANARDSELYQAAKELFRKRLARLTEERTLLPNPIVAAISALRGSDTITVGELAGRQGFHDFEPSGFAWLREQVPARIRFRIADSGRIGLEFRFYSLIVDYPVHDIQISICGCRMNFVVVRSDDPRRFSLQTLPVFLFSGTEVQLLIQAPVFVAASSVTPGSPDRRSLGVGLYSMSVVAEPSCDPLQLDEVQQGNFASDDVYAGWTIGSTSLTASSPPEISLYKPATTSVLPRIGFYDHEPDGFCWLMARRSPAKVAFVVKTSHPVRFLLRFFAVIPDYPVEQVSIAIGETMLHASPIWSEDSRQVSLLTDAYLVSSGRQLELSIRTPLFLPAEWVAPGSGDQRMLGIALYSIEVVGAHFALGDGQSLA